LQGIVILEGSKKVRHSAIDSSPLATYLAKKGPFLAQIYLRQIRNEPWHVTISEMNLTLNDVQVYKKALEDFSQSTNTDTSRVA